VKWRLKQKASVAAAQLAAERACNEPGNISSAGDGGSAAVREELAAAMRLASKPE